MSCITYNSLFHLSSQLKKILLTKYRSRANFLSYVEHIETSLFIFCTLSCTLLCTLLHSPTSILNVCCCLNVFADTAKYPACPPKYCSTNWYKIWWSKQKTLRQRKAIRAGPFNKYIATIRNLIRILCFLSRTTLKKEINVSIYLKSNNTLRIRPFFPVSCFPKLSDPLWS